MYVRNRDYVLCSYRDTETQIEVWENEKYYGNTSLKRSVSTVFFEFSQTSKETRRTGFLIRLENSATTERKQLVNLIIKIEIILVCTIITSTACASFVFLSNFCINLLAFYHECRSRTGYVTRYLFCCRYWVGSSVRLWTKWRPLRCLLLIIIIPLRSYPTSFIAEDSSEGSLRENK